MLEEKDDTILARWLAGELTPEESTEFKQSSEFKDYQKIVEGLEHFQKPSFDREAMLSRIQHHIKQPKKSKLIRLRPLIYVSTIAASVVFIFGLFFNQVKFETTTGEQMAVTLPNGSSVQLNAQSKLTYARFFWKNNKKVTLEGEAFFSVNEGNKFTVETTSGNISVLGTQFNVKSRSKIFEVICYKGKVEFERINTEEKIILNKGEGLKLINGVVGKELITEPQPSWMNGRSSFNDAPLYEILDELKIQYGIAIENKGVDTSKRFTGYFIHNDLEIALKTVLIPMGIEYNLTDDQKILILRSS